MNWKGIMEAIFRIAAELLSLFRISKQTKQEDAKIRQKEVFVERAKEQEKVSTKDQDEKLISEVVSTQGDERQKKLEEIRKIISK